jgi:DNA-binding protein HU-alpha
LFLNQKQLDVSMTSKTPKTAAPRPKLSLKKTSTVTDIAAKPKPAAVKAPVAEVQTSSTEIEVKAPELKKKELIERVVLKSGLKRRDVKPAVEAMLEVLGDALAGGEDLNLQPMGKFMVKRTKEMPNAKVLTVRIRQPKRTAD